MQSGRLIARRRDGEYITDHSPRNPERDHLSLFLRPCLASPRLRYICIASNPHRRINLTPALISHRSNLADLLVAGFVSVRFDLPALNVFLSRLRPSEPSTLAFSSPELLGGTWASALESLRAARKSNGGDIVLSRPSGAECAELTKAQYSAIFRGRGPQTLVEQFLNGHKMGRIFKDDYPNPLLADMDEDDSERYRPRLTFEPL